MLNLSLALLAKVKHKAPGQRVSHKKRKGTSISFGSLKKLLRGSHLSHMDSGKCERVKLET